MQVMSAVIRSRHALLSLMIAGVVAACSGSGKDDRPAGANRAREVGYVTVAPQAVPVLTSLGGRVVAYETSEVRPQVNGIIERRQFTEGGIVRAGQPLFQIDPSLYRAAVNQATANLASARAIAEAARAKAERYRPLAEIEAIAKQDYTDAAAQARVAQATVAQDRAALETARINLRFSTVPAPISGRIGRSLATVGALVSANQADPLAVIQRLDRVYVDMQQSSADLTALRRSLATGRTASGSAQVHLKLEDGSKYAYPGTVQFSEVTVNEQTGTVTLRASFPNPDGLLLPGMFVEAVFDQAVEPQAYLVPQSALLRDFDGSAYVLLVGKGNKAERRKVGARQTYGSNWVVTSGLNRRDRVITQGLNGLKQGASIRAVPADTPQRPGAKPPSGSKPPAGSGG